MNGYHNYFQQDLSYGFPQCPYKETCPVRTQCPVCPHQQEENRNIYSGNHGYMNTGMKYPEPACMQPGENPYLNPYAVGYPYQNPGPYDYDSYHSINHGMSGCPYQYSYREPYGYDNLYLKDQYKYGRKKQNNYGYQAISPQYNEYLTVNPEENINSPWTNNQMYTDKEFTPAKDNI